jgi:beta-N-acetylhexosaminidase
VSDAASAIVLAAIEGPELAPAERAFFGTEQPAGVTLFRRNLPDAGDRPRELVRSLQALRAPGEPPFLVAIDQEGGRVARLAAPFPNDGPAAALVGGRADAAALGQIEAYALRVGRELAALGVNVNFAPVADVLSRPENVAIGDRAFGCDAHAVTARAGAFLRGLHAAGLAACLKHFPGQGDAPADTHECDASIDAPRALLESRELVPFRALAGAAELVMLSHCVYPALDRCQASRSRAVIQGLLRGELGFRGVVASDDMNMRAVPQDERDWAAALVEAVAAGVDLLLVCRELERARLAVAALRAEARRSPAFAARAEEAAGRVRALRSALAGRVAA